MVVTATPIETAALGVAALLAFGFYLWQSYKLVRVLQDPDHPDHDDALEAVDAAYQENGWPPWRWP